MIDSLIEAVPELLYAGVAGVLTIAGVAVEAVGFQTLTAGDQPLGLWMLLVGFVALYAGVKLARERALPALRA